MADVDPVMAGADCVMADAEYVMADVDRVVTDVDCVVSDFDCVMEIVYCVMAGRGPATHDFASSATTEPGRPRLSLPTTTMTRKRDGRSFSGPSDIRPTRIPKDSP